MRNRARRVIKAAYLSVMPEIKPCFDLVFVARSKTLYLKSTDVEKIMRNHLSAAGLLKK